MPKRGKGSKYAAINAYYEHMEEEYEHFGIDPNAPNAEEQLERAKEAEEAAWEENLLANREVEMAATNRRYRNVSARALMNARPNMPENVARLVGKYLPKETEYPEIMHPELQQGFEPNLMTNVRNNNSNSNNGYGNNGYGNYGYGAMPNLEPMAHGNGNANANGLNGGKRRRRRITRRRKASKRSRSRRNRS